MMQQSLDFEQVARQQSVNDELPEFMREAYKFGLHETTKRERAPILMQ
eukprot:CAMPEP_0185596874 /NCGR_PEP_ID=MMETSP0434-20130131/81005_1 /TAXON_ID=626734 ORGANISM="Favella taraikaensis, Strain Fe Narragansett Bay" /NCGR_SAMPLE_ID=MMETSP0434 /ASSEMBLY_ACC=CAM_ASM_000379 /LENGTH=47 /DNA_ID= /DNA_START= /DNA_END= /DNA_ORIENTATION=